MSESRQYEYAVLVVRKGGLDRVRYPDGTVDEVPAGTGSAVKERWEDEQEHQLRQKFDVEVRPTLRHAWEERYTAWREQLILSERRLRSSSVRWTIVDISDPRTKFKFQISPKEPWTNALGPEPYVMWTNRPADFSSKLGSVPAAGPGKRTPWHVLFDIAEAIQRTPATVNNLDEYVQEALEPSLRHLYTFYEPESTADDIEYEAWRATQDLPGTVTVLESQTNWQARLFGECGQTEIEVKFPEELDFPDADAVAALNQVARQGWRVISASDSTETRVDQHGRTELKRGAVRYLLERSRQSDPGS